MRATVMHGAGDVRIESVRDARLIDPTDALVVVTRAAICGSDLWPYKTMEYDEQGRQMGHEFLGVVEAVGAEVRTVNAGDVVLAPFLYSDGNCVFCREGLQSACLHGGRYGFADVDGGQGEAVRVPEADGTLVVLPVGRDDALMPSLLALTDVMATGHHAAISAHAGPGKDRRRHRRRGGRALRRARRSATRCRADHHARPPPEVASPWRASSVPPTSSRSAPTRLSSASASSPAGLGAHSVLECVGLEQSLRTAIGIARPGGAVGRVGAPQEGSIPDAIPSFFRNVTIAGGVAPARAYIDELLPDVLEGRIEPGRVFDRVATLDEVPDGYRAMNDREAIKVMVEL